MKNKTIPIITFFMFMMLNNMHAQNKIITYIPLGDSYTIGTGANHDEAYPALLTKHLNENNITVKMPINPAVNGYTTQDVIDVELPIIRKTKPDFVTLLIGVNDWFEQTDEATFHKNLNHILDELPKYMSGKKTVLLITIPDFGVTPTGNSIAGNRNITQGITSFNTIIKEEAKKRNSIVVDIFSLSQEMKNDATLVAKDGLHGSAKEYALWEKMILPEVIKLLK